MLTTIKRIFFNKHFLGGHSHLGDYLDQKPGLICVSLPRESIDGVFHEVGRIPDDSFVTRIFLWGAGAGAEASGTGPDVTVKVGATKNGGSDVPLFSGNMETLNWGVIDGANGGFGGAMTDRVTNGLISMKLDGTDWNIAGEANVRVWIEYVCNHDTVDV
jgi:hypothetical protein